jgi:hypothetical protein
MDSIGVSIVYTVIHETLVLLDGFSVCILLDSIAYTLEVSIPFLVGLWIEF